MNLFCCHFLTINMEQFIDYLRCCTTLHNIESLALRVHDWQESHTDVDMISLPLLPSLRLLHMVGEVPMTHLHNILTSLQVNHLHLWQNLPYALDAAQVCHIKYASSFFNLPFYCYQCLGVSTYHVIATNY